MDTRTRTIVRYAIVHREEEIEGAADYAPYKNQKDAHDVRKAVDKRNPHHAPHRVVRLTIELEEVEA